MWNRLRKLLVKLVAIETAFVGWLSYWIFLVYANNPSIAAELSSGLQRFPQLSFSTVDIAVLVLIATLAVTLAFKFQRGLRPGIRLERALQMLENLMKRNLVLEAQVAELKIEKSHPPPPVITPAPTSSLTGSEPRSGSWEKAFRTPLEAGPPLTSRATGTGSEEFPFSHETGIPPPRIEAKLQPNPSIIKPTIVVGERGSDRMPMPPLIVPERAPEKQAVSSTPKSSAASWEDSPQFIGESKGILTPSSARKAPTVSDSGGLRQPYIPAPAPKTTQPSVIAGPMPPYTPKITPISTSPKITARPTTRPTPPKIPSATIGPPPAPIELQRPETTPPLATLPSTLPPATPSLGGDATTNPAETTTKPSGETDKTNEKDNSIFTQPTRKKLPLE
ncbi:hypothetical protein E6H15_06370 [Candidatus Bathyarchaeota archaeon]|nr:MAG: hypothetical protein E6H15_06370 [Candidatus Bathyarchaeota archaeon]